MYIIVLLVGLEINLNEWINVMIILFFFWRNKASGPSFYLFSGQLAIYLYWGGNEGKLKNTSDLEETVL